MRFDVLDAWRGIAALTIALFRFNADGWLLQQDIVRHSYLFVDFFFVLSGFVIAFAYSGRLDSYRGGAEFTVRRFGRVWPLHVFMLGLFVMIEIAQSVFTSSGSALADDGAPGSIAANVLLIHSLGLFSYIGWNFPSWSISVEFWTYCLFAVVCLTSRRNLPWVSLVLALGGLLVVALNSSHGLNVTFDYGIFRCIAGFFTGVVVYHLWKATPRPSPIRSGLTRYASAIEAAAILLAFAFVSIAGDGALSFAAPFVFGMVVYVFAWEGGAISGVLRTRPFLFLGRCSYSIYMVAQLVAVLIYKPLAVVSARFLDAPLKHVTTGGSSRDLLDFAPPVIMDLLAVGYLGVVCFVAYLTYRFVETPGRLFFNSLAVRIDGLRVMPKAVQP